MTDGLPHLQQPSAQGLALCVFTTPLTPMIHAAASSFCLNGLLNPTRLQA